MVAGWPSLNSTAATSSASAARIATKVEVAGTIEFQTREQNEGWRVRDSAEVANTYGVNHKFGGDGVPIKGFSDMRLRITAINTDNVAVSGAFELSGHRS